MPRKKTFKCSECNRSFILEASFNDHNTIGLHEPTKPRSRKRKDAEDPHDQVTK